MKPGLSRAHALGPTLRRDWSLQVSVTRQAETPTPPPTTPRSPAAPARLRPSGPPPVGNHPPDSGSRAAVFQQDGASSVTLQTPPLHLHSRPAHAWEVRARSAVGVAGQPFPSPPPSPDPPQRPRPEPQEQTQAGRGAEEGLPWVPCPAWWPPQQRRPGADLSAQPRGHTHSFPGPALYGVYSWFPEKICNLPPSV